MTENSPLISVVIPTCHRNDLLAKCLDCLAPSVQTLHAHQYEVIVTDDGSKSTAEQMVMEKFPWAKWVAGPCKGPAANRNSGAKYAKGEWLAFTDDDCLPDSQWLKAYVSAMGSDVYVYEGKTTCEAGIISPLYEAPINLNGTCLWSCNLMISNDAFKLNGGFDEDFPFPSSEDIDFSNRLIKSGYQILFVPDAVVDHPPRRQASGKVLGARLESQVRLWYKDGKDNYLQTQFIIHFKHRAATILGFGLRRDTLMAVISYIIEFIYASSRVAKWQQKYEMEFRQRLDGLITQHDLAVK